MIYAHTKGRRNLPSSGERRLNHVMADLESARLSVLHARQEVEGLEELADLIGRAIEVTRFHQHRLSEQNAQESPRVVQAETPSGCPASRHHD